MIAAALGLFLLAATAPLREAPVYSYNFVPAVIENGDTLWGLTARHNQGLDSSGLIALTVSYNHLNNTSIQPGQVVYIPVRVRR